MCKALTEMRCKVSGTIAMLASLQNLPCLGEIRLSAIAPIKFADPSVQLCVYVSRQRSRTRKPISIASMTGIRLLI